MKTAQENLPCIVPFQFEANQVRVIQEPAGELWFIAKDVCDVLEHSDTNMAVQSLDDDEKGTRKVCTLRGDQTMIVISESGLYTLIIRSNKPQAKPFRKWVTSQVLPAIRKTGCYVAPGAPGAIPKTLTPVAKEFETALRAAKAAGLYGNKAIIRANLAARMITGYDMLDLLGIDMPDNELQGEYPLDKPGSAARVRQWVKDRVPGCFEVQEVYDALGVTSQKDKGKVSRTLRRMVSAGQLGVGEKPGRGGYCDYRKKGGQS